MHAAPSLLEPQPPSPLTEVADERLDAHGVRLLLKRDDLVHPDLPGNKFRKLRLNLTAAVQARHDTLLTFGGAYSNHLRAVAAAGRLLGLRTVGVVRGEELADRPLNPSLSVAAADGMRLDFVDRATYRRKAEPEVLAALLARHGRAYVLPEGGSNAAAALGCADLGRELRGAADVVAVPCGTGGTLAGLAAGLEGGPGECAEAVGFPVLRGGAFLAADVARLQQEAFGGRRGRWRLDDRFHHGGFARTSQDLEEFASDFHRRHGLDPERVYVAKMLHGVLTLAAEGAFPPGTRVAAVVTG
ncbi:1-aminocyclopropane-1-carboxylate deaminase/D-cysteine desulfhydrase [Actinacidiphila bryophytorum]|uniref:1-aminocyclopropane-1-carboxylate deaminase n=1 Tax=Actinacidiphila bryophytorum TaxID=1436133 RepID=A0A9W4GWD1_9ACTN|nr:pyridoxal-phosphate dependent enzyme [Actinacidiphila bryophytorum]MBM9439788.1 pyridoxal-phosphate dependent enzyme [Actinacidiphila bryophytorum]MBN6546611.1 pyridoxal-phosphate dependent enzyme [Actinacidiphila bryophytorum]CAG7605095.1 1-aminocyclopropane-1-carboxylate deaminase [Actinacidiphila bryophytorum]